MKKFFIFLTLCSPFSALADVQFDDLSKSDVENISKEFSANFSHTGVSAPETDGLWGVEVGAIGGKSSSPDLKDVVEASGGDGSDFSNLYHAGVMARAHFPLDLFAEMTLLPEQEINDIKIKNSSYEIGWNAGGYFGLPLDVAVGINFSNSSISFKQDQPIQSNISLDSKTRILWLGFSKTFLIFTPYVKFGTVNADSELDATNSIFNYTNKLSEEVSNSGSYLAFGGNLQLAFLKLGAEVSQIMSVKRVSGKISFDF